MKAIYYAFCYLSLAIALCSPNVSTFCGNNEQIEDLKTALIVYESVFTTMAGLSAIPITGAAFTVVQVATVGHFAMRLKESFEDMKSSLNEDHIDYRKCSEILEKTVAATTAIKSASTGFSLVSMIPGFGLVLLAPRIASSIYAMLIIRDTLEFWQNNDCQYATTRDCNL